MRRLACVVFVAALGMAGIARGAGLVERAEKVAGELAWYDVNSAMYGVTPRWGPAPEKEFDAVAVLQPDGPGVAKGTKWKPEDIRPLLAHKDGKVRTLGLMLMYDLERVDVLPDIAMLIKDEVETFPSPGPVSAVRIPAAASWPMERTAVGKYALAMVQHYCEVSDELRNLRPLQMEPAVLAEEMRKFAAKRDPELCTAALKVAMERAGGGTTPIPADRNERIEAALQKVMRVPMPRRFYVALAVNFERYQSERFSKDFVLMMARGVPREARLATISGSRPPGDPDLGPWFGARFMLEHAADLFEAGDVELMLKLEAGFEQAVDRTGGAWRFLGSAYPVAAAMLKPEMADEILIPALSRYTKESITGQDDRANIAVGLVLMGTEKGRDAALDAFFREKPERGAHGPGREAFLASVRAQNPVRYRKVVERIIRDERLGSLGPASTRMLVEAASGYLGEELVSDEEMQQSRGKDEAQSGPKFEHLGEWQGKLKQSVDRWAK